MVAVELNIFNENGKQKLFNAGGKDTLLSSLSISTMLKMTGKRVRQVSQVTIFGKWFIWLKSSRRRYLRLSEC